MTFHDISELAQATPPPWQAPLNPRLPLPPIAWVGGRKHDLERVSISELEAWKTRKGLRLVRQSWFGRLGWVSIYEPIGDGNEPAHGSSD